MSNVRRFSFFDRIRNRPAAWMLVEIEPELDLSKRKNKLALENLEIELTPENSIILTDIGKVHLHSECTVDAESHDEDSMSFVSHIRFERWFYGDLNDFAEFSRFDNCGLSKDLGHGSDEVLSKADAFLFTGSSAESVDFHELTEFNFVNSPGWFSARHGELTRFVTIPLKLEIANRRIIGSALDLPPSAIGDYMQSISNREHAAIRDDWGAPLDYPYGDNSMEGLWLFRSEESTVHLNSLVFHSGRSSWYRTGGVWKSTKYMPNFRSPNCYRILGESEEAALNLWESGERVLQEYKFIDREV